MKLTAWDRFTMTFAPRWTLERVRARAVAELLARSYEAASGSRRTVGWTRNRGDSNSLIAIAGPELRNHSRDLLRNNSWAKRARMIVTNNTVGWGVVPKPASTDKRQNDAATAAWKAWAETVTCDADGQNNFAGICALVMRSLFSDGEVLIRRRWRRAEDKLPLPLQLQVLEADFLDTGKTELLPGGAKIINGVEVDGIGRRVGYWLFESHPGSSLIASTPSRRVAASEILHVYDAERAGQMRGVSWLGAAIVNLKELDEFEDAELVRQKIAACYAAFITDTDGTAPAIAEPGVDAKTGAETETFEPGMILHLPEGKAVTVANPPATVDGSFTTRALRKVGAGIGITYEDLTGDYSQVNFSSARMGRIVHQAAVRAWQYTLLQPKFCAGVWRWVMEAAELVGKVPESVPADWTFPPLPQIEPDKETLATTRAIRAGLKTPSEAIREEGGDPDTHWEELAADFKRFKELGLKLDSDPSETSQAGLTQARVGGGGSGGGAPPNET